MKQEVRYGHCWPKAIVLFLGFFVLNMSKKNLPDNSFEFHSSVINNIVFADNLAVLISLELQNKTPVNITRKSTTQKLKGWGCSNVMLPPPAGKQLLKPFPSLPFPAIQTHQPPKVANGKISPASASHHNLLSSSIFLYFFLFFLFFTNPKAGQVFIFEVVKNISFHLLKNLSVVST